MLGYVLLTYGPRHGGKIKNLPAARRQIKNLEHVRDLVDAKELFLVCDYARKIEDLGSLPELRRVLEHLKENRGIIFVDDLGWVLGRVPPAKAGDIYSQLAPYGEHIYCVKQCRYFNTISSDELKSLFSKKPAPYRYTDLPQDLESRELRFEQTLRANLASARVRKNQALVKARELKELCLEMNKPGERASYAALAAEANARGLLTTRGGKWSRETVWSALKRLDGSEAQSS